MSSPGRPEAAEQTLLVGNLESRVGEEILYELFLQAGPLTKVMICEDKEGKPKSFGYVCFKHKGVLTHQNYSCTDCFEHHIDLDSPADRFEEPGDVHDFTVPTGSAVTNIYQIEMKK